MLAPVLHLLCGKIASGKSTLARSLKAEHSAILLSEDHRLSKLYPDQIKSVADYIRHAHRIRDVVGPLVIDMLSTGTPVILDFPANTPADRHWLRSLANAAKVPHRVHYIEVDDDTCRATAPPLNGDTSEMMKVCDKGGLAACGVWGHRIHRRYGRSASRSHLVIQ